jgi:glycosyltransferase involved in cell wall biosynthesis
MRAVVSGSASECRELESLGIRHVHYIPVSLESKGWVEDNKPLSPVRIVHLGGMGTTANRLGLERFFDVVWPSCVQENATLWVVGDARFAGAPLERKLKTVQCTGFVEDLTTVLRPFDIHIVPWEHATGQRTRVPVVLSCGQVIVAVRNGIACYPEIVDGENSILVESLCEMSAVINDLLRRPDERERLGRAARETYERHFTRSALLPRFRQVLASIERK